MTLAQQEAVLKIDIENIPYGLYQVLLVAIAAIVIDLQRQLALGGKLMLPAAKQKAAGEVCIGGFQFEEIDGRIEGWEQVLGPCGTAVSLALQGEVVLAVQSGVQPKPTAKGVPVVMGLAVAAALAEVAGIAVLEVLVGITMLPAAIEILDEGPVISPVAGLAAVAQGGKALLLGAGTGLDQCALGIFGVLGNDVDHAVDRIGPPQGATGTAHHLDALDIVKQSILHVPVDSGKWRRIDTAAVDQNLHLVKKTTVEAPTGHRPGAAVDAGDTEPRYHAQSFRNAGRPRPADIRLADDVHRRGRLADLLHLAADRTDLHIHQFFQTQVHQFPI